MTTFSERAQLTPAYILHSRRYRDTSLILDLFTRDSGRISAILPKARGNKKNQGQVQAFTPLLISFSGSGDLKTLPTFEVVASLSLLNEALLIGIYANELLVRLLSKFEQLPDLFNVYQRLLVSLGRATANIDEKPQTYLVELRQFELCLLTELGYGIDFKFEADSGRLIDTEANYHFIPERGFLLINGGLDGEYYSGEVISAIGRDHYQNDLTEKAAKKIIRLALTKRLGAEPLKSREMFRQFQALKTSPIKGE